MQRGALRLPGAVLFDVDGLLVDTETADYLAWRELYAELDLDLSLGDYAGSAGLYGSWERRYAWLAAHTGRPTVELSVRREARFSELVEARLRPWAALDALLDALDAAGVPVGVASASDRDWVERLLAGLGVRQRFAVVVTGADVQRRKPAPDVYLRAAAALGAAPGGSVALEDSAHGIASARAAGMRVIAIPNEVSAFQDLSGADLRVDSLDQVDLGLLARLLTSSAATSTRA